MNTNAKKSYSSIGIAPSQGLRLTAYRIDSTCSDYITSTGFWAVFFLWSYSTFFTLPEMICTGTACISGRFSM